MGSEVLGPGSAESLERSFVVARWRAAETRIYPLVMVDPAIYEAAVTAVAAVAARLRAACATVGELFQVDVEVLARGLDHAVSEGALAAAGVTTQSICEAALAGRLVELSVDRPASNSFHERHLLSDTSREVAP